MKRLDYDCRHKEARRTAKQGANQSGTDSTAHFATQKIVLDSQVWMLMDLKEASHTAHPTLSLRRVGFLTKKHDVLLLNFMPNEHAFCPFNVVVVVSSRKRQLLAADHYPPMTETVSPMSINVLVATIFENLEVGRASELGDV